MFIQQTFKNKLPILYLVGTPIGNLDDLSFRAVETLKIVDEILCEDTRTSSIVLNKYHIKKPLLSLHKFNELQRSEQITNLLNRNKTLALISDAGVPAISDPGAYLINQLRWNQNVSFNVSVINAGPAYIHAIAMSGFVSPFNYFYGFIKNKNEDSKLVELEDVLTKFTNSIVVFYESVHRIKSTMKVLNEVLDPNIKVTLNRELTKLNEEVIYGTIEEVNAFVQSDEFVEKGEFVIVIDNLEPKKTYSDQQLITMINQEVVLGNKVKDATKKVSELTKIPKNYLYQLYLQQK